MCVGGWVGGWAMQRLGEGVGNEADCAALTPPGFCLKSLP